MADDPYITVEEAADILQVSTRQVHRYGEDSRISTRKAGRRKLFSKPDVEALAADLGVEYKPPAAPKTELLPPSELLHYLRERDQQVVDLQQQLNRAMLEVGRLQGQLEAAQDRIRQLEAPTEPGADQPPEDQPSEVQKPWWARLLLRRLK